MCLTDAYNGDFQMLEKLFTKFLVKSVALFKNKCVTLQVKGGRMGLSDGDRQATGLRLGTALVLWGRIREGHVLDRDHLEHVSDYPRDNGRTIIHGMLNVLLTTN